MWVANLSPFLLLFFSYLLIPTHAQGNGTTRCADSGSDWYINAVGETPCNTYERLRKLCNSNYRVGTLTTNTPPDYCDEQVADCCCNNIAFSLSMLCLTCQVGAGPSGSGVDAGVGAYQMYLKGNRKGFCSPQTNRTLPNQIQNAVCRNNIKIFDEIYNIFWGDGAWFYVWASSTITKAYSALGDGAFSKCPKPSGSSSIPGSSSISSSTSATSPVSSGTLDSSNLESESKGIGGGAIAGIVIGVIAGVAAAILGVFFCLRRRRSKYKSVVIDPDPPTRNSPLPPAPTPYNYSNASNSAGPGSYYDSYSRSVTTSPPVSESNGGASSRSGSAQLVVHNPEAGAAAAAASVTRSLSTRKAPPSTLSYQPSTSDGPSMIERHVDAGPVPVSTLSRNPSGRLPPAYGDVVRG
ncbi:hypothetical protein Moror_5909 [Moniliophthora roreri MCA 2997]|uniref:Uncharacterized protein n=2 Tax=Moniliophthora roreri TaxID=221103 RepID=V2WYY7_MONRO|nr:hypothetical protein Moror_5909 [Moniliophthora roreri MCA 2997]KAI3621616.1 hypothetical protein WG66_009188 [Moniliophthora roreri]